MPQITGSPESCKKRELLGSSSKTLLHNMQTHYAITAATLLECHGVSYYCLFVKLCQVAQLTWCLLRVDYLINFSSMKLAVVLIVSCQVDPVLIFELSN